MSWVSSKLRMYVCVSQPAGAYLLESWYELHRIGSARTFVPRARMPPSDTVLCRIEIKYAQSHICIRVRMDMSWHPPAARSVEHRACLTLSIQHSRHSRHGSRHCKSQLNTSSLQSSAQNATLTTHTHHQVSSQQNPHLRPRSIYRFLGCSLSLISSEEVGSGRQLVVSDGFSNPSITPRNPQIA